MNIRYELKKRENFEVEDVKVNDKIIGWVREYNDCGDARKFHVGLEAPITDDFPALIQGHGDTREEAINDAIDRGTKYAEKLSIGIAVLAAEIGGFCNE